MVVNLYQSSHRRRSYRQHNISGASEVEPQDVFYQQSPGRRSYRQNDDSGQLEVEPQGNFYLQPPRRRSIRQNDDSEQVEVGQPRRRSNRLSPDISSHDTDEPVPIEHDPPVPVEHVRTLVQNVNPTVEHTHMCAENVDPPVEHTRPSIQPRFLEGVEDDANGIHPFSVNGVNGVNRLNGNFFSFPTFEDALNQVLQQHQSDIKELFHHFYIEPAVPTDRFSVSVASAPIWQEVSEAASDSRLKRRIFYWRLLNSKSSHEVSETTSVSRVIPPERPHMMHSEVAETTSVCQCIAESKKDAQNISEAVESPVAIEVSETIAVSRVIPSERPHMMHSEVAGTTSVCECIAESENDSRIMLEAVESPAPRLQSLRSSSNALPSWKSTRKTPWEMIQFRVWNFLEQPDGGLSNQLFNSVLNFLIVVSVASPVMATTKISENFKGILNSADIFFTTLFAVEFLTKVIFYPDRLGFMKSFYTLIDIAVVFAGFLGFFLQDVESIWLDLISTQVPILRLLKITRHSSGWRLLLMAMQNSVIPLLVPLYLMLLMIVFTGSLHFWIDNVLACTSYECSEADRPAFQSIPEAMWFVLVSLSTVGYGDITPHTDVGKLLACCQIVMGLCYMAMPLAIIGNSFSDVWNDRHRILLSDKLAHSAIKRDIKDVKKLFYTFDDDNSGEISLDEFLPFVESLEMGLSRRVICDLFRSIDLDGSGIISFDEFADFVFPDSQREENEE